MAGCSITGGRDGFSCRSTAGGRPAEGAGEAVTLPFANKGYVSFLAKGTEAAIYLAAVPEAVAIQVQEPFARARTKDPDFHHSGTVPVADDREISGLAKRVDTGVHLAAVPTIVAIVQVPATTIGVKRSD